METPKTPEKKNYNKHHPEMMPGEVFLRNSDVNREPTIFMGDLIENDFDEIGWKSKRLGKTAYDEVGNVAEGLRPVFVSRQELQDAGIDPDNLIK